MNVQNSKSVAITGGTGASMKDILQQQSRAPKQPSVVTPEVLADKYTFKGKLGQGSQGKVFEAVRKSDGEQVAIKQLRIDSVSNWKEYDLFHREADVLSTLNLKGVAQFYEAIEDLNGEHPSAYIVQQYIHGKSLATMMKEGYRFTISRVFELALQLLDILESIHTHEPPIIHRDIKPSNILLQPTRGDEYELYLIDFGAVANPQVQAGGSTVAGTYGYMPPEQLAGHPQASSDIYAMGAMLTYMLSGIDPGDMRIADFRLVIDPHLENIPRAIVTTLHEMLEPKPEARLADYKRLREIFTEFSHERFILSSDKSLAKINVEAQMKKLKRLNEPGSLDLWMALPEETPRQIMPLYWKRIRSLRCLGDEKKSSPLMLSDYVGGFFITGVIAAFVIPILLSSFVSFRSIAGVIIGVLIFALLYKLILMILGRRYDKEKSKKNFNLTYKKYRDLSKTLLTKGRKTVATVVSCKYEFVDPASAFPLPYNSYQINHGSKMRPTFVIQYRFNPPDDSSPNDLIHTIRVYRDVMNEFEPGSPLPILYYFSPDNNRLVYSMPYPLPGDSELMIDKLIASSLDNGEQVLEKNPKR